MTKLIILFSLIGLSILIFNPVRAQAAIAIDATSTSTGYNVSSFNWSHTCTGSDLTLVVGVSVYGASSTGATYNTVAMTEQAHAKATNGDGYDNHSYIYTLVNPATGAHSVAVTYSGTGFGAAMAISLNGTDTANPIDVTGTATGEDTNVTKTVTTNYANSYVIDEGYTNNAGDHTVTVNAGQTEIYQVIQGNSQHCFGSYEQKVAAGAITMDWAISATRKWVTSVVAIRESAVTKRRIFISLERTLMKSVALLFKNSLWKNI